MQHDERLAIAALVHDLPALAHQAGMTPSAELQHLLDLAQLDDPSLSAILRQAEAYAAPVGVARP